MNPPALYDEKIFYPKVESGFAFKPYMNNVYVEAFNNQTFNQDGNESAILKTKIYNPPDLIFQHLPLKGKVENIEANSMRNVYSKDTLASVDIKEFIKIWGKVIEIYESVIYRENLKISLFRKDIEKMFTLGQKYKDESDDLMQNLLKLFMKSLYAVQKRKDIYESSKCKCRTWMETEYVCIVSDYWKLPKGNFRVIFKKGDGLDDDGDVNSQFI